VATQAAANVGQANLFGGADAAVAVDYVAVPPWSTRARLAAEKLALGYYFSGHLFAEFAAEARRWAATRLADVKQTRELVKLTGIVVAARSQNTRRGRMGVVVLDDASAQLEIMVFSELYDRKRSLLKEDELLFVTGKVRFDEFNQRLSVSAEELMSLAEARARAAACLRVELDGGADVKGLQAILAPYRVQPNGVQPPVGASPSAGVGCRIVLRYRNAAGCADLLLPDAWRVHAEESLLTDLRAQPKVRCAHFNYA
jgi:DNA polymerase-3 subunit alpha